MIIEALLNFSQSTGVSGFMNSVWGWPIAESVHFSGMCLLIGTVGVFDLRMLGIGKGIPMSALHKLVPFGIAGFILNVISGTMFFTTAPDQYLYNPAFQTKMVFMFAAGLNMLVFYHVAMEQVKATSAEFKAPSKAIVMGTVSLVCWATIIICGRLITYYRPPYHWCIWCT
jgi:hypothetical protein